ncbi:MAG: glycerol-3-phosphate acyltransferase [Oscillospiraceae bacterium]|jgi:glycerol-3-phosphate acyltransferase PlsY|nr:glycerol-3-phosphate acyltransferase [Oscillospiraceae bacterium]
MLITFAHLIAALQAYIIGGVNGAIITSKYLYRRDIREHGSGNPGLTNFYRVFGKRGVLLMMVIDVAKTLAPVLIGGWLFSIPALTGTALSYTAIFGRIYSGFFVMLGHCFPVLYKFRGGKAVLAAGVLLFSIDWRVSIIGWGMFLLVLLTTRYVSLAAIIGVWGYPIALAIFKIGGAPELALASMSALLLVIRHSGNIQRLIKRSEPKFSIKKKGE